MKKKRVGIRGFDWAEYLYISIMAKHVGLDPNNDIEWVTRETGNPLELLAAGKTDAFISSPESAFRSTSESS